jgi:hypothetical protein
VVVYKKKKKTYGGRKEATWVGGRVGEETKVKIQKEKEEKKYKEEVKKPCLFAGKNQEEQRK